MTTRASLKAKLFLAAFSMVLAFGVCEIAARALFPAPPEPAREPGLYYETHPVLGFFHVPGQSGYLDDGFATINEMGLRGELPRVPKPPGEFRVLAIGDSTTFGWGVDDDGTYAAQLEVMLRREQPDHPIHVVNGGVGAYDLHREAKLLNHFAPILDPDLILVGVYWNDLPYELSTPDGRELAARRSSPGTAGVARNQAASEPRRFHIGNNPSTLNRVLRRSRLLYVARQTYLSAVASTETADNLVQWEMALLEGRTSGAIAEAWQDVGRALAEIGRVAEERACQVGVLIIPIRAQVEGHYPNVAYQNRVRELAEAVGFFVIDPLPKFVDAPDKASLFIPYDRMHLTAKGNALLAEAAFEALQARWEATAAERAP